MKVTLLRYADKEVDPSEAIFDLSRNILEAEWHEGINPPWGQAKITFAHALGDSSTEPEDGDWLILRSDARKTRFLGRVYDTGRTTVAGGDGAVDSAPFTVSLDGWFDTLSRPELYFDFSRKTRVGTLLTGTDFAILLDLLRGAASARSGLGETLAGIWRAMEWYQLPASMFGARSDWQERGTDDKATGPIMPGGALSDEAMVIADWETARLYAPTRAYQPVPGPALLAFDSAVSQAHRAADLLRGTFVPCPEMIELFPSLEPIDDRRVPDAKRTALSDSLGVMPVLMYRLKPWRTVPFAAMETNLGGVKTDDVGEAIPQPAPSTEELRARSEAGVLTSSPDFNVITWRKSVGGNGDDTLKLNASDIFSWSPSRNDSQRVNGVTVSCPYMSEPGSFTQEKLGFPVIKKLDVARHGLRLMTLTWPFLPVGDGDPGIIINESGTAIAHARVAAADRNVKRMQAAVVTSATLKRATAANVVTAKNAVTAQEEYDFYHLIPLDPMSEDLALAHLALDNARAADGEADIAVILAAGNASIAAGALQDARAAAADLAMHTRSLEALAALKSSGATGFLKYLRTVAAQAGSWYFMGHNFEQGSCQIPLNYGARAGGFMEVRGLSGKPYEAYIERVTHKVALRQPDGAETGTTTIAFSRGANNTAWRADTVEIRLPDKETKPEPAQAPRDGLHKIGVYGLRELKFLSPDRMEYQNLYWFPGHEAATGTPPGATHSMSVEQAALAEKLAAMQFVPPVVVPGPDVGNTRNKINCIVLHWTDTWSESVARWTFTGNFEAQTAFNEWQRNEIGALAALNMRTIYLGDVGTLSQALVPDFMYEPLMRLRRSEAYADYMKHLGHKFIGKLPWGDTTAIRKLDLYPRAESHFVIKQDGIVVQYADVAYATWNTGNSALNVSSIGIELVNPASQSRRAYLEKDPDVAINNVAELERKAYKGIAPADVGNVANWEWLHSIEGESPESTWFRKRDEPSFHGMGKFYGPTTEQLGSLAALLAELKFQLNEAVGEAQASPFSPNPFGQIPIPSPNLILPYGQVLPGPALGNYVQTWPRGTKPQTVQGVLHHLQVRNTKGVPVPRWDALGIDITALCQQAAGYK